MNLLGSSNVVYIGWKIFLLALVRNIFTFPWAVYLDVTSGGCVLMTVSSVHQHEPVADLYFFSPAPLVAADTRTGLKRSS